LIKAIKNILNKNYNSEQFDRMGARAYNSFFEIENKEKEVPELILKSREKYENYSLSGIMDEYQELESHISLGGFFSFGDLLLDNRKMLNALVGQIFAFEAYAIYKSLDNNKKMIALPHFKDIVRAFVLLGDVDMLYKIRKLIFFIPNVAQSNKEEFVMEEGKMEFIDDMLELIYEEGKTELSLLVNTYKTLDSTFVQDLANELVEMERLTYEPPFYFEIRRDSPGNKRLFGI
jgi:hypothetical protein